MADTVRFLYTILLFILAGSVFSDPTPSGPQFISIEGPSVITAGVGTDFTCSAACIPACTYTWQAYGQEVKGEVVTVTSDGLSNSIELVCTAINPVSKDSQSTNKTVEVYDPVMVVPSTNSIPVEGKPFSMACKGSGPGITTLWLKDQEPFPADLRVQFSNNNGTLTFSSLLPSDEGFYTCMVTNSNMKVYSRGYWLDFSPKPTSVPSGPHSTSIAGPSVITAGVRTDFTCSAACIPACTYTWQAFGQEVKGEVVTVTSDGLSYSIELECTAINPVSKDSQSTNRTVEVYDPVMVVQSTNSMPVEGKPFSMICNGSGPGITTLWLRDQEPFPADLRVQISNNNGTLTFSSLLPSDEGFYTCMVTNSSMKVASRGYWLDFSPKPTSVPSGPYFTSIAGPSVITAGVRTDFTCSAACIPACTYTWQAFGQEVKGEVVTVTSDGLSYSIELECTAINPVSKDSQSTNRTVEVYDPVMVVPSTNSIPVEGKPFSMICNGSGPGITTLWLRDQEPFPADLRVQISNNNGTLTFSSLLPSDEGIYTCMVTNSSMKVASRGYILDFSPKPTSVPSGPHSTSIEGPSVIMAGVRTDFTCSAACIPACTYTWQAFGQEVKGEVVTVTSDGLSYSIELECTAINPVSKDSQSTNRTVEVYDPIIVVPSTNSMPVEGKPFSMICNGSGPGITTLWLRDQEPFPADLRVQISNNNGTLTFSSLLPSDEGFYTCMVTNSTMKVYSRGYMLDFGSINVTIQGPDRVVAGVAQTFTCVSSCILVCSISWPFKQFPQGHLHISGDMITWTPARPGLVQDFTCVVENKYTKQKAQATKTVVVIESPTTVPSTPSSSVIERPSMFLLSLVSLQLLFALSA